MYYKLGTIAGIVGILIIISLIFWFYLPEKYPERVEQIRRQHPELPVKSQLSEHEGHKQEAAQNRTQKRMEPEKHDRKYDASGDMGYGGDDKYDLLGSLFPGGSSFDTNSSQKRTSKQINNQGSNPVQRQPSMSAQGKPPINQKRFSDAGASSYSPVNQNSPNNSQNRQLNPQNRNAGQNKNFPGLQPNGQSNSVNPYGSGQKRSKQNLPSDRNISAQFPVRSGSNPQQNRNISAQFPGRTERSSQREPQQNRNISAQFPGRTGRSSQRDPQNKIPNDKTYRQNSSRQIENILKGGNPPQNVANGGNTQRSKTQPSQASNFDIPGFAGYT